MPNFEQLLAFHRYFIWTNKMRIHFDELVGPTGKRTFNEIVEISFVEPYLSYWYAGLYVLIEGWKELHLYDPTIDDLLESNNVDLLRRYRNGTFHFQEVYFDGRFTNFIEDISSAEWARRLNREFERFIMEALGQHRAEPSTDNLTAE